MACNDPSPFFFENIPVGAQYELSVSGSSDAFLAEADFIAAGGAPEHWSFGEISPGPKKRPLDGQHVVHSVSIFVTIQSATEMTVTVKATIDGVGSYCGSVTGIAGTTERIKHLLRMA